MTRYVVLVQQGPYTRTVHGPYNTFKAAEADARAWQGTVEPIVPLGEEAPDPSPFPEGNQEKRSFTFESPATGKPSMELRGVDELVDKLKAWWPFIIEHDNYLFLHGKKPAEDAELLRAKVAVLQAQLDARREGDGHGQV